MNLGMLIKLIRTHRGMNQKQMADLIGISQNYLSLIEINKKSPGTERISEFAKRLNISNNALIFASSDVPEELNAKDKKDYLRLKNNIMSLLLFELTGELDKSA